MDDNAGYARAPSSLLGLYHTWRWPRRRRPNRWAYSGRWGGATARESAGSPEWPRAPLASRPGLLRMPNEVGTLKHLAKRRAKLCEGGRARRRLGDHDDVDPVMQCWQQLAGQLSQAPPDQIALVRLRRDALADDDTKTCHRQIVRHPLDA